MLNHNQISPSGVRNPWGRTPPPQKKNAHKKLVLESGESIIYGKARTPF